MIKNQTSYFDEYITLFKRFQEKSRYKDGYMAYQKIALNITLIDQKVYKKIITN